MRPLGPARGSGALAPPALRGGARGGAGGGRFDEATPEALEAFRARVPGAEIAILEDSAHRTMLDEPGAYEAILRGFLRRVDACRGAAQWESAGASR